ncbi:MAG: DNA-binding transcriptional MerR regulator [Cognaticolwellia sp.]|jgi:DNA-binding transcriptional MerR regulator
MCNLSYRVKTVCRLTGIHRSTLLAWERRYQVVEPGRADNGYRVYTEDDVTRLRRLKALVDQGHAVSEALTMLVGGPVHSHVLPLLERLIAFDAQGATAISEQVDAHAPGIQVTELYMPLLVALGNAWERGETTIAQEHFTSGFVRERLLRLMDRVTRNDGPLATLMTPPGEKHALGLLGLGVRIAELGWRTDWLGPELPLTELGAYCMEKQPQMICVSLIRKRPPDELDRLIRSMRDSVPSEICIAVGGAGASLVDVEGVFTATGFESLREALASSESRALAR